MRLYFSILNAIITLFILIAKVQGQEVASRNAYEYNVGFTGLKGFIVPHYERGRHLTYGRPSGAELFFNQQTLGKKERERVMGYPQTGFSITYIDTDMVETGKIFNLASYIDFFWLKKKRLSGFFRVGGGLTIATKIYDRETNNLNSIVSTHVSYHAVVRLGLQIPVSDRWLIYPALNWSHTSNGSFNLPNNGINVASFNLGAGYKFGLKEVTPVELTKISAVDRKIHFNLMFSAAGKETEPLGSSKKLYYTLRASVDKQLNRVSRLYGGLEIFHNRGLIDVIESEPAVDNSTDYKRIGLFTGHELLISRVSFITTFGYYIYRPFYGGIDNDPDLYHRHGVRIYINKQLYTTALLKVHGGQADVFDFGIGVRL